MTEDADLGIRIARMGWRVEVLLSTTYEEAPPTLGIWVRQRTRWLKGFMQTYAVHMRSPSRLLSELGPWRFIGFQGLFLGLLLSVLVHPLAYIAFFAALWRYGLSFSGESLTRQSVLLLSGTLVVLGFFGSLLLALTAIFRAKAYRLLPFVVVMPVYWLLISVAGYRALCQFVTNPHAWEKTEHGLSGAGRQRRARRRR